MSLLGLREYARHRGVTLRAVQKAIAAQRISVILIKGSKKIDPRIADKEWEQNTDVTYIRNPKVDNRQTKHPPLSESKAMKEAYLAKIAELDYEERVGRLIEKELVKNQIVTSMRTVRDALLNIPQRIAPEIAAVVDPHACEIALYKEIEGCLLELSRLGGRFD